MTSDKDKNGSDIDEFLQKLTDDINDEKSQNKRIELATDLGISFDLVDKILYLSNSIFFYHKAENEHYQGGTNYRKFLQTEMNQTIDDICKEIDRGVDDIEKVKEIPIHLNVAGHIVPSNIEYWFKGNAKLFAPEKQEQLFIKLGIEL